MRNGRNIAIALVTFLLSVPCALAEIENDKIGFSSNHVFHGVLDGENVDVMTGNLNLQIPLGPSFSLNERLGYGVVLTYNSKLWKHDCDPSATPPQGYQAGDCLGKFAASDSYGLGFSISFGRLWQDPADHGWAYQFQTPDGANHYVCDVSASAGNCQADDNHTVDSSSIWVLPGTDTVWPGNGTKLTVGHHVNSSDLTVAGDHVTRIESLAGASPPYVDIAYSGTDKISSISDSAGRTTKFTDLGIRTEILVPAFAGDAVNFGDPTLEPTRFAKYVLHYQNVEIQDPADLSVTTTHWKRLLTRIELPETSQEYQFGYDGAGYLSQVTLPTGAVVNYTYAHYATSQGKPAHSEMIYREIESEGQTYRWTYQRFGNEVATDEAAMLGLNPERQNFRNSNPYKVRVLDPFNNLTVYRFHHTTFPSTGTASCTSTGDCPSNWTDGLLYQVDLYAGPAEDGSRLVKSTRNTHVFDGRYFENRLNSHSGNAGIGVNSRLASTEVLTPGSGAYPSGRSLIEYTDWTIGPVRLSRVTKQYDGYQLARETYTDFYGSSMFHGAHSYSEVRRPDGTVFSRSQTNYRSDGSVECSLALADVSTAASGSPLNCSALTPAEGDIGLRNTFDGDGRAVSSEVSGGDDGAAFTVDRTYSGAGGYVSTTSSSGVAWNSTERAVDLDSGMAISSTTPWGTETTYDWDKLGRLVAIDPGNNEVATVAEYDPTLVSATVRQVVDPENQIETIYYYDDLGRIVEERRRSIVNWTPGQAPRYDFQLTEYDIVGRTTRHSQWAELGTALENLTWAVLDYTMPSTGFTDPLGRVHRIDRSDGSYVEYDYDGLAKISRVNGVHSIAGAIDAEVVHIKDNLGRLVEVRPAVGAHAHYAYDLADSLVEVELFDPATPQDIQRREFSYDSLGRLRFATNPENGTVEYLEYDARGKLLSWRDSKQQVFTNVFDAAGRLLSRSLEYTDTSGTTLLPLVENEYDLVVTGGGAAVEGRLARQRSYQVSVDGTQSDLVATQELAYGPKGDNYTNGCPLGTNGEGYQGLHGRMIWSSLSIEPWSEPLKAEYCTNSLGLEYLTAYPEADGSARVRRSKVGSLYQSGYLWEVHDLGKDVEYIENIAYGPGGVPLRLDRANGLWADYTYDIMQRPLAIEVEAPATPSRPPLSSTAGCGGGGSGPEYLQYCGSSGGGIGVSTLWHSGTYQYDGAGNIKQIGSDTYSYDGVNRLTGATVIHGASSHGLSYHYDPFGNMTQRTHDVGASTVDRTFTVDWQTNRLVSQDVDRTSGNNDLYTYDYDPTGNMTSSGEGGFGYDWDPLGRMRKAVHATKGTVGEYFYDANGYRVRTIVDEIETFYLRDAAGQVLSEFSRPAGETAGPAWNKDYIYALGKAQVLVKNEQPQRPTTPWVSAVVAQTGNLTLQWEPVDEPDISWYVIRKTVSGSTMQTTVPSTTLQFPDVWDTSVTLDIPIVYTVAAKDAAANESAPSADLVFRPNGSAPPTPQNPSATPGDRSVQLTWDVITVAQDDDFWGYYVEVRTSGGSFQQITPVDSPLRSPEFLHTGLNNGTLYEYRVVAVDNFHRSSSPSGIVSATPADVYPPPRPSSLIATPGLNAGEIELVWNAVVDSDLDTYKIYGGTQSGSLSEIGAVAAGITFFTHGSLSAGTDWYYQVSAVDGSLNESLPSDEVSARPRDPSIVAPSGLAGGFTVDDVLANNGGVKGCPGGVDDWDDDEILVSLSWSAASGAQQYRVYRAYDTGGLFQPLVDLASSELAFEDRQPGHHEFQYYVVSIGSNGEESAASNVLAVSDSFDVTRSVDFLAGDDGRTLYGSINAASRAFTLYWSRVPESQLAGYHVYRRCLWADECNLGSSFYWTTQAQGCADSWQRLTADPVHPEQRIFEDRGIDGLGGCYLYAVRPVDSAGTEGEMSTVLKAALVHGSGNVTNPRCTTADEVRGRGNTGWSIPIATELSSIHTATATHGPGLPDGDPPAPDSVSVAWKTRYPAFSDPLSDNSLWRSSTLEEVRFADVTWSYSQTPEPSDLAGFHVEMATSPLGPWRRITQDPVARWESGYNVSGLGTHIAGGSTTYNDGFTGHLNHVFFRVLAVDESGRESPVPQEATSYAFRGSPEPDPCPTPVATSCPSIDSPENLTATGEVYFGTNCQVRLEWDAVPGATEYYVYRNKGWNWPSFLVGPFFYNTAVVPAQMSGGQQLATQSFIEIGDGAYDDPDCPYGYAASTEVGCEVSLFEAFYVTAKGAAGGESLPSQAVFWEMPTNCVGNDYVASNNLAPADQQDSPRFAEPAVMLADGSGVPGDAGAWAQARARVCLPGENREPGGLPQSPLLTLGQAPDPDYEIFDLHHDHLGSLRLMTDDQGVVISEHKFLPFGEELLPVADFSTKRFSSHDRDVETGLDYMMARYYGSLGGRFLSVDPVSGRPAAPQSHNRYMGIGNNPMNLFDPDGRSPDPYDALIDYLKIDGGGGVYKHGPHSVGANQLSESDHIREFRAKMFADIEANGGLTGRPPGRNYANMGRGEMFVKFVSDGLHGITGNLDWDIFTGSFQLQVEEQYNEADGSTTLLYIITNELTPESLARIPTTEGYDESNPGTRLWSALLRNLYNLTHVNAMYLGDTQRHVFWWTEDYYPEDALERARQWSLYDHELREKGFGTNDQKPMVPRPTFD